MKGLLHTIQGLLYIGFFVLLASGVTLLGISTVSVVGEGIGLLVTCVVLLIVGYWLLEIG